MKIIIPIALVVLIVGALSWGLNQDSTDEVPSVKNEDSNNGKDIPKIEVNEAEEQDRSKATLNLSGQGLTEVSMDIFSQTQLTELNLSHNQLTGALPAEIRHLQNLKTLDLSNNKFTGVPAEIGQLKQLEVLNLSYNQLTGLPSELGNLSSLKTLNLSGNAYSEVDLANIKMNLPATTVIVVN